VAVASKPRPGRYLAVVALALIGLYLGLFLGPAQTPALGLDLRGGTQVTLHATPIGAGKVTKSALNQAKNIIQQRANGLGVGGAVVTTQGSNNIVVSVPGSGHQQVVDNVSKTALLRFRQVLAITSGVATPVTPTPSPSASSTAKAKHPKTKHPKTTKSPKAKKSSSQGRPVDSALTGAKATSSPSPTPTTTPAATPSATPSASPGVSPSSTATGGADDKAAPGSQSRTLTQAFQTSFQTWDCAKNRSPTNGVDDPKDYIIACDSADTGLSNKYLLAPAGVEGTDVKTATAALDSQTGIGWQVNLSFTGSGSSKWQALTNTAYNAQNGQSPSQSPCSPPTGCNAVAIVLDGSVESAPFIQTAGGIPGGQAQISGNFTQATASTLANVLKYGSLPLKFGVPSTTSVSPTLGSEQLRGGLIAGGIGLALVVLFSLVYYRALGLVTIGSLLVSGLILYAITTLLGKSSVGYTLSLPGIAGFIVAVGITADSFVVFFERLRDEVREGIRLRTAVERAWVKARRTIISADSVSLLAAVILYVVSIGDVRGFAFTLGLSTISDLFIVFLFTKPLLSVLAKVEAFDRGKKWTGIGQAREEGRAAQVDTARPRRTRSREA
jgi:preprotein translocase subunit SecD